MFRVLVVCTANICRSPASATLLRREFAAAGLSEVVTVESAGVAAVDGAPACDLSSALVGEFVARHYAGQEPQETNGNTHGSRRVTAELTATADLILALDRSHRAALARLDPAARPRTFTLRHAAGLSEVVAGYTQAGRVPPGAPPLPELPEDRLRWWVAELDAARGMTVAAASEDPPGLQWHPDDVPDPHVVGYQVHGAAIELAEEAIVLLSSGVGRVVAARSDGSAVSPP